MTIYYDDPSFPKPPIQFRRGSTAQVEDYVGAEGEIFVTTDTFKVYVGDGVTPGGVLVGQTFDQPLDSTSSVTFQSVSIGDDYLILSTSTNGPLVNLDLTFKAGLYPQFKSPNSFHFDNNIYIDNAAALYVASINSDAGGEVIRIRDTAETQGLYPDADNTHDIGKSTATYKNLYLDGKVYIGENTLAFDGGQLMVNGSEQIGYTGSAGSNGSTGASGPQGPQGYAGSQGIIGPTGPEGVQGIQGLTGYTGSKGETGYTGSEGATGPEGRQGEIGYTGSQGVAGADGDRYHTSSTSTFTTGNSGESSVTVADINVDYSPGQNIVLAYGNATIQRGTVVSYNSGTGLLTFTKTKHDGTSGTFSSWEINLDGAVGIQGYTGSQGAQGLTGYDGSQGIQGVSGPQGPQGYAGSQGVIGPTGPEGVQGIQGLTGYTGSKGETGYNGSQGEIGYTGSTGAQGLQGIQGLSGPTGAQGTIGFTGSQGLQGVQGDIGYTGSTGSMGAIGYTGSASTVSGPQGPQGLAGLSGPTGPQGSQGSTGYVGSEGAMGLSGPTGPQGATGYTGSAITTAYIFDGGSPSSTYTNGPAFDCGGVN